MQNRFGLKDFVLLILLIVIGISIWLSMAQEDRRWNDVREVQQRIQRLEEQVALMRQSLDEGLVMAPATGGDRTAPATRDESWARPDVPIEWQSPPRYVSDPRTMENYSTGGTFTEIFEAQQPTISPLIFHDVYGRRVHDMVVEYLGRYHPDTLDLEGVLAEAWQYDPGAMWLRVKIWDRARFSDGRPVTADDVVFSYNFMFNTEIQAERMRASCEGIESVEAIDTKVVEFQFKEPRFDNLSTALVALPVLPQHFYEEFNETPSRYNQSTGLLMGSGPYRLRRLDQDDQWSPPRDVVLERNEQYWGPRPALDRLRFKVVSEAIPRLTAFNNRDGDMMRPTDPQYARMSRDERWLEHNRAMMWYPIRGGYNFIIWNCGQRDGRPSRFADARVRKAMTHLLDRERIIREIHEGAGTVSTGPFNPSTPQANPDIEPWPHSVERARELLREAGWTPDSEGVLRNERGDAFTFEFTYSSGSEVAQRVGNYLSDQCARVGIRCNFRVVDWSVYRQILNTRDFDALTMAWSPSVPEGDPFGLWHSSQAAAGDNYAQWRNEEADRLIEAGRREVNTQKRMEIWHDLHRVIHEEQPYTFIVDRPWLRFVNRDFENVHPYKTGIEYAEFFIPASPQAKAN